MGMIGRTNTIILFCSKVYVGFTLPNEFEIAKTTLIMDMAGRTNNFFYPVAELDDLRKLLV